MCDIYIHHVIEPLDFALIKVEIILLAPVVVIPPSTGFVAEVIKPITNIIKPGMKNPRSATKVLPPQVKYSRKDAMKNNPSPPHRLLKDPSSGKCTINQFNYSTHNLLLTLSFLD